MPLQALKDSLRNTLRTQATHFVLFSHFIIPPRSDRTRPNYELSAAFKTWLRDEHKHTFLRRIIREATENTARRRQTKRLTNNQKQQRSVQTELVPIYEGYRVLDGGPHTSKSMQNTYHFRAVLDKLVRWNLKIGRGRALADPSRDVIVTSVARAEEALRIGQRHATKVGADAEQNELSKEVFKRKGHRGQKTKKRWRGGKQPLRSVGSSR